MNINPWEGTCSVEGCNEPSEWPGKEQGTLLCQEHWEEETAQSWWDMLMWLTTPENEREEQEQ